MKKLIIVGAGGFGREALSLAKSINEVTPAWEILGFIDDNPDALDGVRCTHKIIGRISDWEPKEDEEFALGIASPAAKEKVSAILKNKGAKFATLISPRASVREFFEHGEGCIITGSSTVGDNVTIGNFVHISGSMIGQDSKIGDYSTTTGFTNIASATLGKRVFVGSHAVVLNHLTVGDDAFICAGSVVFSKVKAGVKVFGVPAKKFEF